MANRTTKQQRDIKLAFAKALIISNPNLGKDAINKQVRKEYGTGLRRIDVAKLKDATLLGRPKKSTGIKSVRKLVEEQVLVLPTEKAREYKLVTVGFDTAFHMMRSAGFLPFEIQNVFSANGVSLVFGSNPFKAMLKSRRAWVRDKKKRGWSNDDIILEIKKYYSITDSKGQPKHSPFDFLRKEYEPRPKKDKAEIKSALSKQYEKNKQRKAAISTEQLYGRGHRKPLIVR